MPRTNRKDQFDPKEVTIVHCRHRCVRRAFLAGTDPVTKKDYSGRKEWIQRRIEALASIFAIDVLSYSILSNHMHVIVRNRPDVVATWSDQEVALRWLKIFPGVSIEENLVEPTTEHVAALAADPVRIAELRVRLAHISWFMRSLAEPIARRANREDGCTGHFWEGRFKATPIKDEIGVLACAMYVDINPVKAALATTPDTARFTSAYDRIAAQKGERIDSAAFELKTISAKEAAEQVLNTPREELVKRHRAKRRNPTGRSVPRDAWLAPVQLANDKTSLDPETHRDGLRASDKGFLTISQEDYLTLLRWTAAQQTEQQQEEVPAAVQSVLAKYHVSHETWVHLVWNWKKYFSHIGCIGRPETLAEEAQKKGKRCYRGASLLATIFSAV